MRSKHIYLAVSLDNAIKICSLCLSSIAFRSNKLLRFSRLLSPKMILLKLICRHIDCPSSGTVWSHKKLFMLLKLVFILAADGTIDSPP